MPRLYSSSTVARESRKRGESVSMSVVSSSVGQLVSSAFWLKH